VWSTPLTRMGVSIQPARHRGIERARRVGTGVVLCFRRSMNDPTRSSWM
jgi:hypothetical protein